MSTHQLYRIMPDGTVKQTNPFTGTEVWSVPTRGRREMGELEQRPSSETLALRDPEDYCSFCESRYVETTPEKSRVVLVDGRYEIRHQVPYPEYVAQPALFRRVSNLYEIVGTEYWMENYNYKLSHRNEEWKERYLTDLTAVEHVLNLVDAKLRRGGRTEDEIAGMTEVEKLLIANGFFGGGHELIIARRHYRDGARTLTDRFSTGDFSDEEHYQYLLFVIDAMRDIVANNRYVRYLAVYKNWLSPAGASFEHLHTQIVSIDEWGESLDRQIEMCRNDRNVFNTLGANFAGQNNLIFAENDAALAFVGIGHRYPTIEIYSKSMNARPYEHEAEEIRGLSDLVRAIHAAIGPLISVNEEWYYAPIDSIYKMPWHINIKLRVNVPAGFEGGTGIFLNPMRPLDLRDAVVPRLYQLRGRGGCAGNIRIAEECRIVPNPLQYFRN